MKPVRRTTGFTLIELLIVVAIIGIIAAIAIPNLLNAVQRAKQKRTMSDMRSLGLALERYSVDFGGYPAVPEGWPAEIEQVAGYLENVAAQNAPTKDGWTTPFFWSPSDLDGMFYSNYLLMSFAKDLTQDAAWTKGTETRYFDCDIVYGNGLFLQVPEGIQKN